MKYENTTARLFGPDSVGAPEYVRLLKSPETVLRYYAQYPSLLKCRNAGQNVSMYDLIHAKT